MKYYYRKLVQNFVENIALDQCTDIYYSAVVSISCKNLNT